MNTILAALTNPNNTKMKKLFVFGAAIALMATFASCKKDYTCTCSSVTKDATGDVISSGSASGTVNDTKKKAEEKCEEGNASFDAGGGYTTTTTCKID